MYDFQELPTGERSVLGSAVTLFRSDQDGFRGLATIDKTLLLVTRSLIRWENLP